MENFFSKYKHTIQSLSFIIAMATIVIVLNNHIDKKIEKKITDQQYIDNISKSLRPFLIFNNNEVVLYDHGANKFVHNINFDNKKDIVDIFFTKYIQNEPLLITIGDVQYSYKSVRIKRNGWRFFMHSSVMQDVTGDKSTNKYILEILP